MGESSVPNPKQTCSFCSHSAEVSCPACGRSLCFTHFGAGLCPACRVTYQRWVSRAGTLLVCGFTAIALLAALLITLLEGSLLHGLAAAVIAVPLVSAVGVSWFRWVAMWWFRRRQRARRLACRRPWACSITQSGSRLGSLKKRIGCLDLPIWW